MNEPCQRRLSQCGACRPTHSGFTLLETILALMVFSIAVVALVGAINSMGNASIEARRTREVQSQVESMILEITRKPPQEIIDGQRTYGTTFRKDGVEYSLKMTAEELINADRQPLSGIYSVKAFARWADGGHQEQFSTDTMVYPPLFYERR